MRPFALRLLASAMIGATAVSTAAVTSPARAEKWDPRTEEAEKSERHAEAAEAITAFRENDPTLATYFDEAYGYAVFPSVTKGGAGIGGARGKGLLFQGGRAAMKAYVSEFSIGAQLGGKKYSEIVFFRDKLAYDSFVDGEFEFSAQAAAVISKSGAGAATNWDEGVAVFLLDKGGAMAEASIAGQRFKVKPLD